jgi:hypothetical protein
VRWSELFADLGAEAADLERAERDGEVADRTRAELGRVALVNRLRSAIGRDLSLVLAGGPVSGRLLRVGSDWLLLACPQDTLVPLAAVAVAADLPVSSVSPAAVGAVESRLPLASVLRAIAVDRARVVVTLRDGTAIGGTPDRIGSDFFDVLQHAPDVAPRAADVTGRSTIPYAAISKVVRDAEAWA